MRLLLLFSELCHKRHAKNGWFTLMLSRAAVAVIFTDMTSSSNKRWLEEKRSKTGRHQNPQKRQRERIAILAFVQNICPKGSWQIIFVWSIYTIDYFVTRLLISLFIDNLLVATNLAYIRKKETSEQKTTQLFSYLNESVTDFVRLR